MKKLLLFIIASIIVIGAVHAETNESGKYLPLRAENIKCLADWHLAAISSITTIIPDNNLSTWTTKLQDDETQLSTLATAGDNKAFNDFVQNTLRPDLKDADQSVKDLRSNLKTFNITKAERQTMRQAFADALATYKTCQSNVESQIIIARADYYEQALQKARDEITNLDAKNISTTDLTTIVNDAETTIVQPLKASTNASALKEYCLWDGCKDGINFHFAAKYAIAKLSAVLLYLTPYADSHNVSVTSAKTAISTASTNLAAVGTAQYTSGQSDTVWNAIKDAQKSLTQLRDALKVRK